MYGVTTRKFKWLFWRVSKCVLPYPRLNHGRCSPWLIDQLGHLSVNRWILHDKLLHCCRQSQLNETMPSRKCAYKIRGYTQRRWCTKVSGFHSWKWAPARYQEHRSWLPWSKLRIKRVGSLVSLPWLGTLPSRLISPPQDSQLSASNSPRAQLYSRGLYRIRWECGHIWSRSAIPWYLWIRLSTQHSDCRGNRSDCRGIWRLDHGRWS
jgi:hypothetical protein